MEWYYLGAIVAAAMLLLLASGMPIAFALWILGFGGYWMVHGFGPGLSMASTLGYSSAAAFTMTTAPLFIIMGEILLFTDVGKDLFDVANKWLGRFPGGLGIAALATCGMFGAISGASIASVVTVGKVAVPAMVQQGYDRKLAVGIVTAGAATDVIIPPSVMMIVFGVLTEQSVGRLFIAAFIPGFLMIGVLMAQVILQVIRKPALAPLGEHYSWKEKMFGIRKLFAWLIIMLLVLGTIYFGVCTASEAAAVGAFAAFCLALITRRLGWGKLWGALLSTVQTTSMLILVLTGARAFASFLAVVNIPQNLAAALLSLDVSPWLIVVGIHIVWLVLGCFLNATSIIVLTTPLFFPALVAFGFDPLWIGTTLICNMAISLITPPVALNLFVAASTFPEIPFSDIVRGTLPFVYGEAVALAIVIAFPILSLWLPGMMFKPAG